MCKAVEKIVCGTKIKHLRELNTAMEIINKSQKHDILDRDARIKQLERHWDEEQGPPPAVLFTVQSGAWVWDRLIETHRQYMGSGAAIHPLLDGQYRILTSEEFLKMAKWLWVDNMEYIEEFFDCDDFADVFIAMAIKHYGIRVARVYDWSGSHAYCLPVLFGGVKIWEPQKGIFISWNDPGREQFYPMQDCEIQV